MSLALFGETEILPLVAQLSPEYTRNLMTKGMLVNRSAIEDLANTDSGDSKDFIARLRELNGYPSSACILALTRIQSSRFRGDVYFDRPNILNYRIRLHVENGNDWVLGSGYDIVENGMAVRAEAKYAPFVVRLVQGVTDTEAEAMLASLPDFSPVVSQVSKSASGIFLSAAANNAGLLLIRNKDDPRLSKKTVPKRTLALIKEDLADGYIVILPENALSTEYSDFIGWWRTDPVSGHLLGLIEPRCGGLAEYEGVTELVTAFSVVTSPLSSAVYIIDCISETPKPRSSGRVLACIHCGISIGFCQIIAGLAFHGFEGALIGTNYCWRVAMPLCIEPGPYP